MTHGLAGVILTTEPGRPISVCECKAVAAGVRGLTWAVVEHEDGTRSYSPSFDWPGHFHVTADHVPVLEWSEDLRADDLDAMQATP